jgi:hypothetical protein
MTTSSIIPADIRERITTAATALYEESGRDAFPTVDRVRRAARVDMNAASAVMRDWRRQQTAPAAPVAVSIPEALQTTHSQALAATWLQAQELANDALRAGQVAWEIERAELDAMRDEMASAYERQAADMETLQGQLDALRQSSEVQAAEQQRAVEVANRERADATTRAERAEGRLMEVERVALADAARVENVATRLRGERDAALQRAAEAREATAALTGRLEAIEQQNVTLLATLRPPAKGKG